MYLRIGVYWTITFNSMLCPVVPVIAHPLMVDNAATAAVFKDDEASYTELLVVTPFNCTGVVNKFPPPLNVHCTVREAEGAVTREKVAVTKFPAAVTRSLMEIVSPLQGAPAQNTKR